MASRQQGNKASQKVPGSFRGCSFVKFSTKSNGVPFCTIALMMALVLGMPSMSWAQNPPPPDNFLDDDDFDMPPGPYNQGGNKPGVAPPAGQQLPKGFGGDAGQTPGGPPGGPSEGKSVPAQQRHRGQAPSLLKNRPSNMAEATDKDITDENFPDIIQNFDFPNAEINDVVKAMSELTGKNFIVDPQVHGKITIIAPTPVTVAEAYKAFLSALAINSLTVVPSGKFLKVKQALNANRDNIETYSGSYAPNVDVLITRIVTLKYISAKEIYGSLGPMLVSKNGEIRAYEPTNTLILSDYGSNIDRVMKILRQLDVPGFEEQLEVIRIRYAKAGDLAKLVDQIINKGKTTQPGSPFTAGIPRFTPLGGAQPQGSEAFSLVIPDDRTNSLIVVGNTSGIDKIKKLVARLDFKLPPEEYGNVQVYYVKWNDAEKIAATLSGLAQQAAQSNAPSPIGAPGGVTNPLQKATLFTGDVKIVSDKNTNSLVITASKQDYEIVKNILAKLDVARDQVFVEGVIASISLGRTKSFGITYYNLAGGSMAARSGFAAGKDLVPLNSLFDPSSDQGAVLGFGGGGGVTLHGVPAGFGGTGTQDVTVPNFLGFLKILSSITDVDVLSTPQIMVMDNEDGLLEVGQNVVVGTTVTAIGTTGSQQTPDRKDVVVSLKITPHISPGSNLMRLTIEEKADEVGAIDPTTHTANLEKKLTKTTVRMKNQDTLVLGGLTKDKTTVLQTKVPLLGDIPILGWLFKSKQTTIEKSSLVLFLTPKIVRTAADSASLLKQKIKERVNFIEKNAGGKDIQGEFIDSLQLQKNGKTVPVQPDAK